MVSPNLDGDGNPEDVNRFIAFPVSRKSSYRFDDLFKQGEIIGSGSFAVCETCRDRSSQHLYAAKVFGRRASRRMPQSNFPYNVNQEYEDLSVLMSLESNDILCIKAIFDEDQSTIALMVGIHVRMVLMYRSLPSMETCKLALVSVGE